MTEDTGTPSPFPGRLRETRNLRGLDQAELGELAKIPATSISHFESGNRKPSLDNLRKLADALRSASITCSDEPIMCQPTSVRSHIAMRIR